MESENLSDRETRFKYLRIYTGINVDSTQIASLQEAADETYDGNSYYGTTTTTYNETVTSTLTKPKLNKIGDKLAILNQQLFSNLTTNGQVQIYEYSSSDASWNYFGNKIESAAYNDISGGSIDMNETGSIVAIGYPEATGDDTLSGFTKVFTYDSNDASWNQISSNINGESNGDYAGTSVSLDKDGNYLAIGAPYNGAGKVSVLSLIHI